jgi:hypothetical protein
MKKIFIRSPYFIEVDEPGQSNAKIEIFLWNKGTTEPTIPNYTLTKSIASPTQTLIAWNVSNFAKEFIKPIAPGSITTEEEDLQTWCYMRVVSYSNNEEVNDETFVCLNGYTQYLEGYNQSITSSTSSTVLLVNPNIKFYKNDTIYVNVFFDAGFHFIDWYGYYSLEIELEEPTLYKIVLSEDVVLIDGISVKSEEICENIYTPITCTFINRFGGWQYLTFFKANQQGIDITSKDYNLLHSSIDYNVLQGQKQRFNFQGKQKIKCNTGWVDENYSELIQDLLLSEVVLLDNKPAIVKSQSADIKTHLKDKNINYEIDFEYNYGLINDVI